MATIKAIEAKSIHQIQSGQVIVDLCSVVKELVENSLDAEATSVEVSFKNNGLDAIEVRDNGAGISPSNYASIALKHHTSKLSSYNDLSSLNTFGFRGEALSSLCALSNFSIITAGAHEVPKGNRLEFERSGVLKSITTVAAQKGTTATVENLFEKLPVRRKELAKNIKREYGKVLSLLHAYACIGINVKFTVKNAMPKAKSMVIFSTKGNATTRDNIANVYGAKALNALATLEMSLDFQSTLTQESGDDGHTTNVVVHGHISKPVFGEGRQGPDRQMFFVNGRPCGLPQIAKAINEVYKSFNVSQSPFIFADFRMDTNAYDVNVSPDKRTILLHNAANLIERLKFCLTEMFDKQEQTVPQSQIHGSKLPAFRHLDVKRSAPLDTTLRPESSPESRSAKGSLLKDEDNILSGADANRESSKSLFHDHFRNQASTREEGDADAHHRTEAKLQKAREKQAEKIAQAIAPEGAMREGLDEYDDLREPRHQNTHPTDARLSPHSIRLRDFNTRIAEYQRPQAAENEDQTPEEPIASTMPSPKKNLPGVVQNAYDQMRPKRTPAQIATITIDGETTTQVIGSQLQQVSGDSRIPSTRLKPTEHRENMSLSKFSRSLRKFGGLGTQPTGVEEASDDEVEVISEQRSPQIEISGGQAFHGSHDEEIGAEDMPVEESASSGSVEDDTKGEEMDDDYIDEAAKKAEEEARVAELIRAAEDSVLGPSKENMRRANKALKGGLSKDSTTSLLATIDISLARLQIQLENLQQVMNDHTQQANRRNDESPAAEDEETHLSLTVSKRDFSTMEIAGQFNLGFILAVRRATSKSDSQENPLNIGHSRDELFIIDQHASDEKFNFERLQAETVIDNQRMVQSATLDLTAVEEETVLENTTALEKNGFIIEIDTTGESPVGRRVTLLTLPISREVTFDTRDLDELIHLLSEAPMLGTESAVPRPSRVRKMFAMRACRSSVMIGKTMSKRQMQRIVTNMGTMEKPWNCPHGRPTMRHLTTLDGLGLWDGDYHSGGEDEGHERRAKREIWMDYLAS